MMEHLWDVIATAIVLTSLVAMGLWIKAKGGLDSVFKRDAEALFKMILTLSSLFDIVVLVMSAVKYRGAMFAGAIPRFVIVTVVEILVNLFMVTQFNNIFQYWLYEHDVDVKYDPAKSKMTPADSGAMKMTKTTRSVVWWLAAFIFSIGGTYVLWVLYLESIENLYLVTEGLSFPKFIVNEESERIPEISAFAMIWASTALEILICIITLKNYNSLSKLDIDILSSEYEAEQIEKQALLKVAKDKLPEPLTTPITPPAPPATPPTAPAPLVPAAQSNLASQLINTGGGGGTNPK